jgi:lipid II:glycine glycyltransferase (peptidoglycan interpeptide bridge formation enzyme)
MPVRELTKEGDLHLYKEWLSMHPKRSLWQSLEWKRYQEALGKEVRIYASGDGDIECAGLVVIDKTALGLSTWDIPYGPLWQEEVSAEVAETFVSELAALAKKEKCISLYHSCPVPELSVGKSSGRYVYPEASRIVDLAQTEEELLAQMKPKGRYNIKVAQKHGIAVRESKDIDSFIALHAGTAKRDAFTTPAAETYRHFLADLDNSFLLFAFTPEKTDPIAGLLGVFWEDRAIYYYGASDHAYRANMAPYALQWETLRFCKQHGTQWYSLFGEAPKGSKNHPWAGVTAFKEKFGGQYVEFPPERKLTLKPAAHCLLNLKRKFLH